MHAKDLVPKLPAFLQDTPDLLRHRMHKLKMTHHKVVIFYCHKNDPLSTYMLCVCLKYLVINWLLTQNPVPVGIQIPDKMKVRYRTVYRSKSGPFVNRSTYDHSKSGHVRISDPHCICLLHRELWLGTTRLNNLSFIGKWRNSFPK